MNPASAYLPGLIKGVLISLYILMVFLLYRHVVVEYGLYFSIGYEEGGAVSSVLCVSVFCYLLLGVLGNYGVINSAYKLFSLCFVILICAPALLIGAISSLGLSPLFTFNLVLVSVVLVGFTRVKDVSIVPRCGLGGYCILFPLISVAVFAFYLIFVYRGDLSFVALDEVYTKRAQAKQSAGFFIGYAVGWVSNFASPILIVAGLYGRRLSYVFIGISGYLLIYMLAGHKSSLISIVFIFGVYYFAHRLTLQKVISVSLGALVSVFVVDFLLGRAFLAPYTFDRMVVAPSVLSLFYFDFFESNEPIYLSHSILRAVVSNPYRMQPPEIIGSTYFDGDWANVNFVGEGFANFHTVGVVLFLFFTVFIVKLYDSVSHHLPLQVRLSIFAPVLLYLMNASPLTLMVTGGLLPLMVVIFFSSGLSNLRGGLCR